MKLRRTIYRVFLILYEIIFLKIFHIIFSRFHIIKTHHQCVYQGNFPNLDIFPKSQKYQVEFFQNKSYLFPEHLQAVRMNQYSILFSDFSSFLQNFFGILEENYKNLVERENEK